MDYKILCENTIAVCKEAGLYIRSQIGKVNANSIDSKGMHDFVSIVDKTSEKMIIDKLQKLLPESGFIAEENTSSKVGEVYNWIIDPLDGTTNFLHGVFPFAISVALQENNETVLGIVYEIGFDECFYAWKNSRAYLNGKPIAVSKAKKVADTLIATGFPYSNFSKMPQFMLSLDYFMQNSHGMRRLGSAATDLAYVACGRYDAFYEYALKPWDVAAGAFILQQAGGTVSDFSGGQNWLFGQEIVAANANVFNEFQAVVSKLMNAEQ
ncbi:MAG TPA: inositol monophosphatase [Bacteroidales bacterium]|nr:inositol monophosphatase [Bacteroidales bacterium]